MKIVYYLFYCIIYLHDSYQLKYNSDTISADIQNKLSGILEFDPDGGYGWDFLESR